MFKSAIKKHTFIIFKKRARTLALLVTQYSDLEKGSKWSQIPPTLTQKEVMSYYTYIGLFKNHIGSYHCLFG